MSYEAKANAYNTYIAPSTATVAAAALLCHRLSGLTVLIG